MVTFDPNKPPFLWGNLGVTMIRPLAIGLSVMALAAPLPALASYDGMVASHAAANGVPESLVRRVIKRESGGNARVVSKGNYGLMQIRLGTARAMGYSGSAAGLLDPNINMTYAVKYLAGAYRAAGGNADLAVRYYQTGYYAKARSSGFSPYSGERTSRRARAREAYAFGGDRYTSVSTKRGKRTRVMPPVITP